MKEEREIKLLINQKHYGFMNLQSGFVARYILAKIANLMIIHPIKEKREKNFKKSARIMDKGINT